MRVELKELNTEQLLEYIVDLRGIECADDWSEARPVTLMTILEEALANHRKVLWIVELEDAQTAQESAQDEPEVVQEVTPEPEQEPAQEVVQIESESTIVGQESVSNDSAEVVEAAEAEPEKASDFATGNWTEYEKPAKHKSISDLGEWAKYRGRALTTSEQNYVIKGMKDEGYSFSVISNVVRLSVPTVSSRYKKMTGNAD